MRQSIVSFEVGLAALATFLPLVLIFGSSTVGSPMLVEEPPFQWLPVALNGIGVLGYVVGWIWIVRIVRAEA